jgi:hypothetical protein
MGRKSNPEKVSSNGDHWNNDGTFVHYGKPYGLKLYPICQGEWDIKTVLIKESEKENEDVRVY